MLNEKKFTTYCFHDFYSICINWILTTKSEKEKDRHETSIKSRNINILYSIVIRTIEYINDKGLGETVRVLTDDQNKEVERKIIPYMPPDKYAYKYEWTGREVIDRGLQELESLDLAMEFARRAEEALNMQMKS